jgi:hypothetical protein
MSDFDPRQYEYTTNKVSSTPVTGAASTQQHDEEIRLARESAKEWQQMAFRLYSVLGCSRREHRRQMAEAQYLKMAVQFEKR